MSSSMGCPPLFGEDILIGASLRVGELFPRVVLLELDLLVSEGERSPSGLDRFAFGLVNLKCGY